MLMMMTMMANANECIGGQYNSMSAIKMEFSETMSSLLTSERSIVDEVGTRRESDVDLFACNALACASASRNRLSTWGDVGDFVTGVPDIRLGAATIGVYDDANIEGRATDLAQTRDSFAAVVTYRRVNDDDGGRITVSHPRIFSWGMLRTDTAEFTSLRPVLIAKSGGGSKAQIEASPRGFSIITTVGVFTWAHSCEATVLKTVPLPSNHRLGSRVLKTALAWADAKCASRHDVATDLLSSDGITAMADFTTAKQKNGYAALDRSGRLYVYGDATVDTPYVLRDGRYDTLTASGNAFLATQIDMRRLFLWPHDRGNGVFNVTLGLNQSDSIESVVSTRDEFAVKTRLGHVVLIDDKGGDVKTDFNHRFTSLHSTRSIFIGLRPNRTVVITSLRCEVKRGEEAGGDLDSCLRDNSGIADSGWWLLNVKHVSTSNYSDRVGFIMENGQAVTWGNVEHHRQMYPKRCTPCEANTRSEALVASTQCVGCAAGYWSLPGSETCRPCAFGLCDDIDLLWTLMIVSLFMGCIGICLFDDDDDVT